MRKMKHQGAAIVVACMAVSVTVEAADVPILGTKLVVKDTRRASKLVFKSKDPLLEVPGFDQGPDTLGATLTILNPTTGKSGTLNLGVAGWRVNRSGTTYKYNDGLVKVLLRNRRVLKIKVRNTVISVRDESQGTLGVLFEVGPQRYCALFDPFSIRRDQPCKFVAKRAAAPVTCPSTGGSPSGAFVTGRGFYLPVPTGSQDPGVMVRPGSRELP